MEKEIVNAEIIEEKSGNVVEVKEEEKTNLLNLEKPKVFEKNYEIIRKNSNEVHTLVKEIDVKNVNTILTFGAKPAEKLSKIADDILSTTKNVQNIEATAVIKNLTKLINKIDFADFEKAPKKEGGFLSKLFNKAKDALEKYESMDKEINVITQELLNYKVSLGKDQEDLQKLYSIVNENSVELTDYIYAMEIAEKEVRDKLDDIVKSVNVDEDVKNREIAKTQTLLDMMEQKRSDLEIVRTVSLQTMPMIEIMAKNNYGLARKLYSSLITTLPIFKNAIILAVQTRKQLVLTGVFTTLDTTTKELLLQNSVNISKNSVKIAQIANTPVIKFDDLRKNFEIIERGIQEARAETDKARELRKNNIIELHKLNSRIEKEKAKFSEYLIENER